MIVAAHTFLAFSTVNTKVNYLGMYNPHVEEHYLFIHDLPDIRGNI